MAHPVRDFLPGRRLVLAGAAAAFALPGRRAPSCRRTSLKGTMARFKLTSPPRPMPDLEFLDCRRQADAARRLHRQDPADEPVGDLVRALREGNAEPRQPAGRVAASDKFVVLPISLDGPSKAKVAPFYKDKKLTSLGIYFDKGRKAMSVLDVSLLPTSILVDPAGRELGRLEGDADWDTPEGIALMKAAF